MHGRRKRRCSVRCPSAMARNSVGTTDATKCMADANAAVACAVPAQCPDFGWDNRRYKMHGRRKRRCSVRCPSARGQDFGWDNRRYKMHGRRKRRCSVRCPSAVPGFRLGQPTLQCSALQHSNTPTLQHSNTPTLQHSNTPTLHDPRSALRKRLALPRQSNRIESSVVWAP